MPPPSTIPEIHARAWEILDYENDQWLAHRGSRHDWHTSRVYQNSRAEAAELLPVLSTLLCGNPHALGEVLPTGPDDPDSIEAVWLLSAPTLDAWAAPVVAAAREYAALVKESA